MTKTELLKDLMRFQVSRYNYRIVGHSLYFILPNNNFAVAKLIHTNKPNDYNGISITCVNVPFGEINACELLFSDIFYDENTTTIIKNDDGGFGWYRTPTVLDKLNLSDHIGKYFEIISFIDRTSMFASSGMPYLGLGAAAIQSSLPEQVLEYKNGKLLGVEVEDECKTISYEPIQIPMIEEEKTDAIDPNDTDNLLSETKKISEETKTKDEANTVDILIANEASIKNGDAHFIPTDDTNHQKAAVVNKAATDEVLDAPAMEPVKKKSFFRDWFAKKEEKHPKKASKTALEKNALAEMKEAVKDKEIPEEKIFQSWDIQADADSDVKAALKKTQEEEYELRIFGKGDMANLNIVPWEAYAFNIHKVIVYEGVTSIGDNAFKSLKYMDSVEIADSVIKIGASAFEYCENLTEIVLPGHLEEIGEFAFSGCDSITKFILPDSMRIIHDYAFDFDRLSDLFVYCENPDTIRVGAGIDATRFLVKKSNL